MHLDDEDDDTETGHEGIKRVKARHVTAIEWEDLKTSVGVNVKSFILLKLKKKKKEGQNNQHSISPTIRIFLFTIWCQNMCQIELKKTNKTVGQCRSVQKPELCFVLELVDWLKPPPGTSRRLLT